MILYKGNSNISPCNRLVPAGGRHGARERGVPDALQLLAGAAEGPLPGHAAAAARAGALDQRRAARAGAAAAESLVLRAARYARPLSTKYNTTRLQRLNCL